MVNVGDPRFSRRRMLVAYVNSDLLYRGEVWAHALDKS